MAVSLGLASGLLVHTTAAAFGLSLLIAGSPLLFNIVKFAGVAYLLYMGFKAFIGRNKQADVIPEEIAATPHEVKPSSESEPFFTLYKRGITMNLLNPKVIIFFLAFLPQFIDTASDTPKGDIFLLGGIFAVQAVAVFSAVALLAGFISDKLHVRSISHKTVSIINAVVYWGIALAFLFTGL